MACQSCLDTRRKFLGAVGLTTLQSKVPVTVRELLYRELIHFVPAMAYPLNVRGLNMMPVRHIIDVAIPSARVGIDVGYQKLTKDQQVSRDLDVSRAGWLMFSFTPEHLSENMVEVAATLKKYL